jgi:hypothetical protein
MPPTEKTELVEMRKWRRLLVLAAAVVAAGGGAVVPGAVSGPALAASDAGQFHVFSVSPSGNLYQDTWSGSWLGWQDLGNDGVKLTGTPSVAYNPADGSYHAYAVGTNGSVYQDLYTPSAGWGTWQNLSGGLQGGINAAYVPASTSANCTANNNCAPQTFADAVFTHAKINAPVTAANEFAFETWERAEGGGAGCPGQPANKAPWTYSAGPAGNPINTEQTEPGSTPWNSAGVQIFANADGQTCWYWGLDANTTTLLNGDYQGILNVLDNPSASSDAQCVALAQAVGDSPWGTGNFQADCSSAAPRTGNNPVPASPIVPSAQLYVDGPSGMPHYVISVSQVKGSRITGSLCFLYQDGRTGLLGAYTATKPTAGTITLVLKTGKSIKVTVQEHGFTIPGCAKYLPFIYRPAQCTFTFHGDTP